MRSKWPRCVSLAFASAALFANSASAGEYDLLVTSYQADNILRFDGDTGAFSGVFASSADLDGPTSLVFGADYNLYVTSFNTDRVIRFNGDTGEFIGQFTPSGASLNGPRQAIFGPDGRLYVCSAENHAILRYNERTGNLINSFAIPGPQYPLYLTFGPDGNLYVTSRQPDRVLRYDGATGALLGTFASHANLVQPNGIAFGADGHLYVASNPGGPLGHFVMRFNGESGAFMDVFTTDSSYGYIEGIVFGPDGDLYLAAFNSAQVLVVNHVTGNLTRAIGPLPVDMDRPTAIAFLRNPGACCRDGECRELPERLCTGLKCNVADLLPATFQGCYADVDGSGVVNAGDRGVISANIGNTDPLARCLWDLDNNGVINIGDRGIVLANVSQCEALPFYQNGTYGGGVFFGPDVPCSEIDCDSGQP